MIILPAIDIIEGRAVRLYKGDYSLKTEYGNPADVALDFKREGATHIHIVDLDGAKSGQAPNFELISRIANNTDLFVEVGGGIRSLDTVKKYLDAGVSRVIIGTAAITDSDFLDKALDAYGEKIAVGVDILDEKVRIKGWLESSGINVYDFVAKMEALGVKTVICTDISKDGAMSGTNLELYKQLKSRFELDIIASGGVSSMADVIALRNAGLSGAIIGKAYYMGAIRLKEAIEAAK